MRQRHLMLITTSAHLLIFIIIGSTYVSAQQPISPTDQSVNIPEDLERRMYQLEVVQSQTIEALKSSNDSYKSSMMWFSLLITILIAIQGGIFYGQWRREGERVSREIKREETRDLIERTGAEQFSQLMDVVQQTLIDRESRQARYEKAWTNAELKGVEDVSKVMALVEQTLESRLAAEKEARDKLDEIRSQIGSLDKFYKNFQIAIERARDSIEKTAAKLAPTLREGFRSKTNELISYSQQFDDFQRDFAPLEEDQRKFSPHVPYIRGIAAHYANQPDIAKKYLSNVIGIH